MNFLTQVTGPPLRTVHPIRCGCYYVIVTSLGFVVGDPRAFGMAEIVREASALPSGSGYINGRLHLRSKRFPMYFPDSSPRLLLVSRHLTAMPLNTVPAAMRETINKQCPKVPFLAHPNPEMLINVLPCFEIHEDSLQLASC